MPLRADRALKSQSNGIGHQPEYLTSIIDFLQIKQQATRVALRIMHGMSLLYNACLTLYCSFPEACCCVVTESHRCFVTHAKAKVELVFIIIVVVVN